MAAQNGAPVLLDATGLEREHGPGFLAERFPTINAACLARGLDWTRVPLPVTPAAHYWMGGIRTDLHGRTSIPGLLAFGETACTGVHGANRLASNSLLESLVFATRAATLLLWDPAAALAPADFDATPVLALPGEKSVLLSEATQQPPLPSQAVILSEGAQRRGPRTGNPAGISNPAEPLPIPNPQTQTRRALQTLLWNAAGIERNGPDLAGALAELRAMHFAGDTVHARETANLHQLALALTTAALARRESRGAHFRDDFPHPSAAWAHPLVYAAAARESGRVASDDAQPALAR